MFGVTAMSIASNSGGYKEWEATISIKETNGCHDYIVIGEKEDASELVDQYDVPKCPPPPPPHLYTFMYYEEMPYPYTNLWYDYRNLSIKTTKEFDLRIMCNVQESTEITISWNKHDFKNSGYKSILLYDSEGNILKDMRHEERYSFSSGEYSYNMFYIRMTPKTSDSYMEK